MALGIGIGSIIGGGLSMLGSLAGGDDSKTTTQKKEIPERTATQQRIWDMFVGSLFGESGGSQEIDPDAYIEQSPEAERIWRDIEGEQRLPLREQREFLETTEPGRERFSAKRKLDRGMYPRGYGPVQEILLPTQGGMFGEQSIFDLIGDQADHRRSEVQNYLEALRELNQGTPSTQVSFGGEPMGEMFHTGGYNFRKEPLAEALGLGLEYTPQAGDIQAFNLLQDLVKQIEDRRYGLATTSQDTTYDYGFNPMGTAANIMQGAKVGNEVQDWLKGLNQGGGSTPMNDIDVYGIPPVY